MIKLVQTVDELHKVLKNWGNKTIGFVPTMGYLHLGHISLMQKARDECDCVVLSIFVNPMQFGANEDLDQYPRDIDRDIKMAKDAGVDILFFPSVHEMYPNKLLTKVQVQEVSTSLCGSSRPGHFDGVALVVTKLFNMVSPHRAYFGAKDAQQVAVIKQLVIDLSFPIEIVVCPTFREEDGLAMSSRNVYLTEDERREAVILYKALHEVEDLLGKNTLKFAEEVNQYIRTRIEEVSFANIDYVETLSYPELCNINELNDSTIIVAVAVKFGKTRLIDNLIYDLKKQSLCCV